MNNFQRFLCFIFGAVIVAGAWYGFLFMVKPPPMDTTPALIMVWASVCVLLFSIFPDFLADIFAKVKKIKVKDFELEFQESVTKASSKYLKSFPIDNQYNIGEKGSFANLCTIMKQARKSPEKPILLIVNVGDNSHVSIYMLFIYLFFIDIAGSSVTVLFIDSREPVHNNFSEINRRIIIGVTSGKLINRVFLEQFPNLIEIHKFLLPENIGIRFQDFFLSGRFPYDDLVALFRDIDDNIRKLPIEDRDDQLTRYDVDNWFKTSLCKHIVELPISEKAIKEIRQILVSEDEFFLVFQNRELNAVVPTLTLTRSLSKKVLEDLL
ncbi:MAG: hypothetical protein NTX45_09320 [Proteobacteria bacterium]|nr:hypothetical protein [Pseudomonadota bacterium]